MANGRPAITAGCLYLTDIRASTDSGQPRRNKYHIVVSRLIAHPPRSTGLCGLKDGTFRPTPPVIAQGTASVYHENLYKITLAMSKLTRKCLMSGGGI